MLLKNYFNKNFYNLLCEVIKNHYPKFNSDNFIKEIFCDEFKSMELKERIRHTTHIMRKYFPNDLKESFQLLEKVSNDFEINRRGLNGLEFLIFPDYVEIYGINDLKLSIKSIEKISKLITCEFAVRPFLIKYEKKMIEMMYKWSTNKHHSLRRLSSEGIRPRLPWAIAIPSFKNNPAKIFPILENLIYDDNISVRKSVANNLNDISKDNPNLAINFFKKWIGKDPEIDKIIKHGSRTLLKKGNQDILKIHKLKNPSVIKINCFEILDVNIRKGDKLNFIFEIENTDKNSILLRLEYSIYFRIKNGSHNKKVFKISEVHLSPEQKLVKQKNHNFKPITTRVYHPGEHKLGLIINGVEKKIKIFNLKN